MDIPAIQHVDDITRQTGDGSANWEIFKRINALLDNSVDLTNLSGITLPPEHVKGGNHLTI